MEYITHLSKDKKLAELLTDHEPFKLKFHKNICLRLCSSIMSQQLSTKVAKVIYNRFLDLFGSKEPTAQQILDTPFETLRAIGLSNAKTQYIHNVCTFFIDNKITDARLNKMSNDDVIELLT